MNHNLPAKPEQGRTDDPDKRYFLMRPDSIGVGQVGNEWYTHDKRIDLTDIATTSVPKRTLIKLEGSDAPRYLVGYRRIIDIAESKIRQKVVYHDLGPLVERQGGRFEVVIGGALFEGMPPVSGIMQEDTQAELAVAGEEPVDSPFYRAQALLRSFPDNTARMNQIVENDVELAKLIGA